MKKTLITLFLIIDLAITGLAQDINFKHIGLTEGLPQLSVMSIWCDDLNQMWFATRRGLCYYDGSRIRTLEMRTSDGKTEKFLRSQYLCGDKKGNIFFVNDDELVCYNKQLNGFRSLGKKITNITRSQETLWANSNGTIFYLDSLTNKLNLFKKIRSFSESRINCMLQTNLNQLWIGMDDGLIWIDNQKTEHVLLSGMRIQYIFEDNKRNLWIASNNGLYIIKPDFQTIHYTHNPASSNSLISNNIRVINQDIDGNIWVGTQDGLNKFDPYSGKFSSYVAENLNNSIANNSIRSVYCDKHGTIWIGSFMGGVNYFNPKEQIFKFISSGVNTKMKNEAISLIYPIDRDKIIFSSYSSGVAVYNKQTQTTTPFNNINGRFNINNIVYNINSNNFYCIISSKIFTIDIKTLKIKPVDLKDKMQNTTNISSLASYNDQLFISTSKGIYRLNTKNNELTPLLEKELRNISEPYKIIIDNKERLWILFLGSEIGCYNLKLKSWQLYKQLLPVHELQQTIRNNNIFEDSKHRIWLATLGKGIYLFNEKSNQFEVFADENNGLMSNFCFDIKEGLNSNLVLFESKGVVVIDADKRKFTYIKNELFPADKIMTDANSNYVDSQANIFIGTSNGIIMLNQNDLSSGNEYSSLFFSHLYVNSDEVLPNDGSNILKQTLPYTSKIKISSKNKSFDIDISKTSYLSFNNSQKEYTLEGFEKQWNKLSSNRIHYTNIKPGNYVLRVRESQNNVNKYNEISLPIEVYPPFYASTLAWIIYFILLAYVVITAFRFFESRRKLSQTLELEQRDKLRMEELNQAKVKFYINISHEFRTPISLIKAQIETILINHEDLVPVVKNALQRVLKNTDRLQNLVSEILDFRKLESGKMQLNIIQCNIVEHLAEAIDMFKESTNRNGIKLSFDIPKTEIFLYVDIKLFTSAVNNLLNNAFKFTPEDGEVKVNLEENPECVIVRFTDTGIGIPAENINKIFERFYQAPNATTNFGTGIGLSFVKDIVEAHGGAISVCNNPDSGCTFTITLKKGYEHFTTEEINVNTINHNTVENTIVSENESDILSIENSGYETENTILIVEDNKEMLNLLADIFSPIYQVKTAEDGEIAIEILKTIQPDLILSDVMMSKVSGIELCTYVKNNYETCHIPVVLLTAKNLDENKIEGLQIGADDYIVKPFNTKLLITRCNNIINNRRLLQEKFAKQIDFSPKIVATNESDIKFINQAHQVIEKNLANFDFDVDVFCKEMYISRVKLYNKIKGLTGMTIKDFIQNVKLKKAADYLVNRPDLLITDITYMLGFSSPRYFSKSFKDLFGIIPTEYREKNRRIEEITD